MNKWTFIICIVIIILLTLNVIRVELKNPSNIKSFSIISSVIILLIMVVILYDSIKRLF